MNLSIVITSLNDPDIENTCRSIRETAGGAVEILVIDDCSATPVTIQNASLRVRVIHNRNRCGVGPSRHIGVIAARNDFILLTDAHMRFSEGWLAPTISALQSTDKTLICGQCLAVQNASEKPSGAYNGARMILSQPSESPRYRILTAKWRKDVPGKDFYELSACMGALYAFKREFFLRIGGTRMLHMFGCDEELLSIKTLLFGGEIRLLKKLQAAHIFRRSKTPFKLDPAWFIYNSIVTAETCLPDAESKQLIGLVERTPEAFAIREMLRQNSGQITVEKAALRLGFTVSWQQYLEKLAEVDSAE